MFTYSCELLFLSNEVLTETAVGCFLGVEKLLETAFLSFKGRPLFPELTIFVRDIALATGFKLVLLEFIHAMHIIQLFLSVHEH